MFKVKQLVRSMLIRLYRLFHCGNFRAFGNQVYVFPGVSVDGAQHISLGDHVVVQDDTVLSVHSVDRFDAMIGISIGAGSNIGRRNHIYAFGRITIGQKVLTAANVYISDCTHEFSNPNIPIIDQAVRELSPVTIGDGTWIGQGACIIGCRIGRNCVVGANSVVLKDVADYSVVAGAPARLIRQFDPTTQQWIRPEPNLTETRS